MSMATLKTQAIVDMIREHPELSYRDIAGRFDVSRQRVGNIARAYGITRPMQPVAETHPERECPCCGEVYRSEEPTCGSSMCKRVVAEHRRLENSKGRQAYELRLKGLTWVQVAEELGYAFQPSATRSAKAWAESTGHPWPPRELAIAS